MSILAMDFRGSVLKYALVDRDGRFCERNEMLPPVFDVESFVSAIREVFQLYKKEAEGVSLCLSGEIDTVSGLVTSSASYPALCGENIYEILGDVIPVPVVAENEKYCSTLAEMWKGALRGYSNGINLCVGTTVTCGIVIDRVLYKGGGMLAGNLTGMLLSDEAKTVNDLGISCGIMAQLVKILSAVGYDVSMQTILSSANRDYTKNIAPFVLPVQADDIPISEELTISDVLGWIKNGHPVVRGIYRDYIRKLAVMIHNINTVMAPDVIAISGGFCNDISVVRDIQNECDELLKQINGIRPLRAEINIVPSHLKNDANLVGAVCNYITRIQNDNHSFQHV